jgi:aldehyde dehydrogenase (NAD+)
MLDKIGTTGEKLVCGGGHSKELRMIEPTVVLCGWDSELMQEELFCPSLCVIPYCNLKDAAVKVRSRPKPLALYIFSRDIIEQRTLLDNTTSGGVTINGVIYHAGHSSLPFGGVGERGLGVYHGRHTIDCFQHKKPVLQKWRGLGDMGIITDPFFIYGPYRDGCIKTKLLRLVGYMS